MAGIYAQIVDIRKLIDTLETVTVEQKYDKAQFWAPYILRKGFGNAIDIER